MPQRIVILHYHLFKNAGTSFDRVLQSNFGDRLTTAEFPGKGGDNSKDVAQWILENDNCVAFSSHSAIGPLPVLDGIDIIPVLFLRSPIDRLKSVYRFEHRQEADTWAAELAKEHDFSGYVHHRLARPADRQCRNFQTYRLAAFLPGKDHELARALQAVDLIRKKGVLGRVENFSASLERFARRIASVYPDVKTPEVHENATGRSDLPVDPTLYRLLVTENLHDLGVIEYADRVQDT